MTAPAGKKKQLSLFSTVRVKVKDPDAWGRVIDELNLKGAKKRKFEHGEYATLELIVDSNLRITGRVI